MDGNDTMPPLTTVNQSLYEQGMRALELIVEMYRGKKVAPVYQPTKLVIRESCGCFSQATQMETPDMSG